MLAGVKRDGVNGKRIDALAECTQRHHPYSPTSHGKLHPARLATTTIFTPSPFLHFFVFVCGAGSLGVTTPLLLEKPAENQRVQHTATTFYIARVSACRTGMGGKGLGDLQAGR